MLMQDTFRKLAEACRYQLLLATAFIGERDRVAFGTVVAISEQGMAGRLKITTDSGESTVWRISRKVIAAIRQAMPAIWQG